jgi:16S rRNA (cytidine1402-2'-O)-methyltransferase
MPLFIVATPIGNLADITFRAVETLKNADLVAAEDTRTAKKLFAKFDIHSPLTSFHSYSTEKKINQILNYLRQNKKVALISEAGTPCISDPGYKIVAAAAQENLKIVPIPGPCAAIAALTASSLPTAKFIFLGFPPRKKGRKKLFESLREKKKTVIFYESPHRVLYLIKELKEILGVTRKIVLARELTKIYEEFFRGNLAEAEEFLIQKKPRGEFVVLIGGAE